MIDFDPWAHKGGFLPINLRYEQGLAAGWVEELPITEVSKPLKGSSKNQGGSLMNRQVLTSVLVILVAVAAIAGGTLAWFTAGTDPLENAFTAGTVVVSAGETVMPDPADFVFQNWNPGDEVELLYTIKNEGSKVIHLRADIEREWVNWTPETPEDSEGNLIDVVSVEQDSQWQQIEGKLYYHGAVGIEETVTLKLRVKLSGPLTDNSYQGHEYNLATVFEAIQSSHDASADAWGVTYDGTGWSAVTQP